MSFQIAHCAPNDLGSSVQFVSMRRENMKTPMELFRAAQEAQKGAVGYMILWLLGIPASVLLVVFLLRGCT
jgi:hypothetical protein